MTRGPDKGPLGFPPRAVHGMLMPIAFEPTARQEVTMAKGRDKPKKEAKKPKKDKGAKKGKGK